MTKNNLPLFSWSRSDVKLFAFVLFLCFLAKGASAFRGVSIDDYQLSFGVGDVELGHFLSQGRIFGWLVAYLIDWLGVNLNDTYFAMAIIVMALQAALTVSMLRFVGYKSLVSAGIIGGLMTLHPYTAEVLTYKVILPVYALALCFTIIAIELVNSNPNRLFVKLLAIFIITAALMTYQASLNYLLVAAFGSLLMSAISNTQVDGFKFNGIFFRTKGWLLLLYSSFGSVVFLFVISLIKNLGLVSNLAPRSQFIELSQLPKRLDEVKNTIRLIFLQSETIFPVGLKFAFFFLFVGAIFIIVTSLLRRGRDYLNSAIGVLLILFSPLLVIGIIIPFNDWWPVPRVLAHSALLFGVIFAVADSARFDLSFNLNRLVEGLFVTLGAVIIIGFVFIDNQIFADQQKIAQWDRFKANRIVARLEGMPEFDRVKKLCLDGGRWGYPVSLQTTQGDMNLSAFAPSWSKAPLVLESTGYNFGRPSSQEVKECEQFCKIRRAWPDRESVSINGEIAVVCLER